jgi:hypothetical protein
MSTLSQFFSSGGIKSVQTGHQGIFDDDVTVNAVDPNKSFIVITTTGGTIWNGFAYVQLTNATTVSVNCTFTSVHWQLIEFY